MFQWNEMQTTVMRLLRSSVRIVFCCIFVWMIEIDFHKSLIKSFLMSTGIGVYRWLNCGVHTEEFTRIDLPSRLSKFIQHGNIYLSIKWHQRGILEWKYFGMRRYTDYRLYIS